MFDLQELKVLLWAVEVAADAVTIKSAEDELPNDDAMRITMTLIQMEEKLHSLMEQQVTTPPEA